MSDFYAWPEAFHALLTIVFVFCMASQTLAVLYACLRRRNERRQMAPILREASVLWHVFTYALLHGQIVQLYDVRFLSHTDGEALRIIAFAAVALSAVASAVCSGKPGPLLLIAVAGATAPFVQTYTGSASAYLYLSAMLFWLTRSIIISMRGHRQIRTGLSALSVKNAVDALHTGVMFCERDGFALLTNLQMQRLMIEITGKVLRNGRQFYGLLSLGDINPRCRISWFEDQNVIILPDESAWKFSVSELLMKRKIYTQLTATDITAQWRLNEELQPQKEELTRRRDELSDTIANLHIVSHERETQRAKMRAHDILGERLTLMLRAVRSEQTPDFAVLRSMSQGLIDELKAVHSDLAPQDELDILIQAFASIGVEIVVHGNLPQKPAQSRLFTDTVREAVTNAVRHGLATRVNIYMDSTDGDYHLRITDNGHPPDGPIKEGGGISGVRNRVVPLGGALHISVEPRFVLAVKLPGGDGSD